AWPSDSSNNPKNQVFRQATVAACISPTFQWTCFSKLHQPGMPILARGYERAPEVKPPKRPEVARRRYSPPESVVELNFSSDPPSESILPEKSRRDPLAVMSLQVAPGNQVRAASFPGNNTHAVARGHCQSWTRIATL